LVGSYALLTRPPLDRSLVRLACVRHAASVRSEPGSNSQVEELSLTVIRKSQPKTLKPTKVARSRTNKAFRHCSQVQLAPNQKTVVLRFKNRKTLLLEHTNGFICAKNHTTLIASPQHRRPRIPSIRTPNCSRATERLEGCSLNRGFGARRSAMEAPFTPPPLDLSTTVF
jgi:hypothetical protein